MVAGLFSWDYTRSEMESHHLIIGRYMDRFSMGISQ